MEALRASSFPEERVRIVTNDLATRDGVRASTIEEALGQQVFWQVPFDQRVRGDAQVGEPAVLRHPSTAGARSLTDLAKTIVGIQPSRQGLFSRLPFSSGREGVRQRKTTTKESQA
jgi:Flp pilus assembly CpaE family ATPase